MNEFVSKETRRLAERMIQMIRSGKLRNHKLGNTSVVHHGEAEEKELMEYGNFLRTKNFYMIMQLCGSDNDEEY